METRGVSTAEPVVQEQHVGEVGQLQLTSQLSLLLATHDVRLQKKRAVFSADRTEYGYLENPKQLSIRNLQEPVAVLAFLRSPHLNASKKQHECGRTQPLCISCWSRSWKTNGRNLKGLKTNINNNHETQYIIITTIINPNLKISKHLRQSNYWRILNKNAEKYTKI